MTHRRLFQSLLLISTLMAWGTWASTSVKTAEVALFHAKIPFTIQAYTRNGTVGVEWISLPAFPTGMFIRQAHHAVITDAMVDFGMERNDPSGRGTHVVRHVWLPLWVPWLVMVGAAFVAGLMQRTDQTTGAW